MYALARACCLVRYRNCGSGLSRKGSSLSLNRSRYMAVLGRPTDLSGIAECPGLRSTDEQRRMPAGRAPAAVRSTKRQVPELAARAGRFAVVVQVQTRLLQPECLRVRHLADEVEHARNARGPVRRRAASPGWRAGGSRTGWCPRLRWSSGPSCERAAPSRWRCSLPRFTKNSMVSTPVYRKCLRRFAQVARGRAMQRRRAVRRAREAQDAAAMHVAVEWIDGDLAAAAARADDRYFAVERHQAPRRGAALPSASQAPVDIGGLAQHALALAVVAAGAGF